MSYFNIRVPKLQEFPFVMFWMDVLFGEAALCFSLTCITNAPGLFATLKLSDTKSFLPILLLEWRKWFPIMEEDDGDGSDTHLPFKQEWEIS